MTETEEKINLRRGNRINKVLPAELKTFKRDIPTIIVSLEKKK